MAPFNLMAAGVSFLAKSFSVLSCTSTLARCTSVLPAAYINPVKYLTSQASGPPKKPLNGYMIYCQQQKPIVARQNPEISSVEVVKKIAQQWRMLGPEQKRPFQEAFVKANEQFKVDLKRYQAQLTPVQLQRQALEKKQRLEKKRAIRKKRELNSLGKPKRPRSAFNIFMSEHFEEARGTSTPAKMKSLVDDWRNLFSHQKQVYTQLAEDDKIRYKNEMKSWEEHMIEIGREDVIRETSRKRATAKSTAAKSGTKKVKVAKKATGGGKSKTTKKTSKSTSAKTASQRSTKKS